MPAPARADYPLLDVDAARSAVSTGRTVRVGILPTHQFPDGTAGRIKLVGGPESDGPEFIQVEVNVGGAKDVIPFAPADLSPITRAQAAPEPIVRAVTRRLRTPRSPAVGAPVTRPAANRPVAVARLATGSATTSAPAPAPEPAAVQPSAAASPSAPASASAPSAASAPDSTAPRADTGRARKTAGSTDATVEGAAAGPTDTPTVARKAARGKRQPITVTLSTTEPDHTGWQLEVKVGNRVVVKPAPLHPARAWALVTDLGNPEVARVVAGALNEHRQQALERADRLARELAEAQEELANYPTF